MLRYSFYPFNCLDVAVFFVCVAAGSGNASLLKLKSRSYTYSEIVSMTHNFENIIGEGGFGKVYLGELNDGTQVAVKLLSQSSKQGFKEFLSEVRPLKPYGSMEKIALVMHYSILRYL